MTEEQQTSEAVPAPSEAKEPYRRVIEIGDGVNPEVFEADSMEELANKLAEGKKHASRKIREMGTELRASRAMDEFIAAHPDEFELTETGRRNGELMRMRLAELQLPVTRDNLAKAYLHLQQSGLLTPRGESAQDHASAKIEKTEDTAPTQQPKVEAPRVTRKSSGITTHNRAYVPPANTEPSEDDAYRMPMSDLRKLANKQMSAR